jgi:hypothetical protein
MSMAALIEVRDSLVAAGVVRSECEFSERWLGKSECYMRGLRYSGTEPSADAWANCAAKLGDFTKHLSQSSEQHHKHWAQQFDLLRRRCFDEIDTQAQRKWRVRGEANRDVQQ